jgi:NAD(P)-dependent dehydrogenase (short-subunit alcohol dehydrogenase family)
MKLKGKIAIVTGAARGTGGASATLFAREGAKVTVADVLADLGQETVRLIEREGGEAQFVLADVGNESDIKKMTQETLSRWGRIDILFNNAGVGEAKFLEETTEEEWDRIFDVNLKSIFRAVRYVVPQMRRQGGGVILNMGSISGLVGQVRTPVYNATKGAILLMTKSMAADYAADNIRVNCLCPGVIDTPGFRESILTFGHDPATLIRERTARIPIGRFLSSEDIARAALYLVSDDSEGVTGIGHLVDGGLLSVPEYSSSWFPKKSL